MVVGEVFTTKRFGEIEVVDYSNNKNVTVKFKETGWVQSNVSAAAILKGFVKDNSFFCTEGVVSRLKKIHGDRFDYSKVEYSGSNSNVTLVCRKHGEFCATPHNLLKEKTASSAVCPKCKTEHYNHNNKGLSQESFLSRADAHYAGRYDLSSVRYSGGKSTVEIVCKQHGSFFVKASSILNNKGCDCPLCCVGDSRKTNATVRTSEALRVLNVMLPEYSFSIDPDFCSLTTSVSVQCFEHGLFNSTLRSLLRGKRCAMCAKNSPVTLQEWKIRAVEKHGYFYDYSMVNFSTLQDIVEIICPEHGVFTQRAADHMDGKGCRKCKKVYRPTTEEWVALAKETHGCRYDYSEAVYTKAKDHVSIICREHGLFRQAAFNHLQGVGCPRCAEKGFAQQKPGVVYILANSEAVKVGITNRSGTDRLKEINEGVVDKFSVVWEFPSDGVSCLEVERNTHSILREMGYKNPTNIFDGRTECFVGASLPMVYDIVTKQFERVKHK